MNIPSITIVRLWDFNKPLSIEPDIESLFKRPRTDFRISEYIFEFIDEYILKPNKILQKGNYRFCLAFGIYNPEIQKFHQENPYNNNYSKFRLAQYNRKAYKEIQINCNSTFFNENIEPIAYAWMVYDMFAVYLTTNFKKITKEIMEDKKMNLDKSYITDLEFPAKFENQKYIADETSVEFTSTDGYTTEKREPVIIADIYKEKYPEKR